MIKNLLLRLISIFSILFFTACASHRVPILPGEIPTQNVLTEEEINLGAQVFRQLSSQFPIDNDLNRNRVVREIVYDLSDAAGGPNGGNPWHTYVFKDDNFKNAAATRGNYIFVWSGIINTANSKDELATVLAHEVAHVLASHTIPTVGETMNQILVGTSQELTQNILIHQGGGYAQGAQLAGALTSLLLQSLIVNPQTRKLEFEADTIGLFLMAKAGYNPNAALDFWDNMTKDNPDMSLSFLSSHPPSRERVENIRKYLPEAYEIYRRRKGKK